PARPAPDERVRRGPLPGVGGRRAALGARERRGRAGRRPAALPPGVGDGRAAATGPARDRDLEPAARPAPALTRAAAAPPTRRRSRRPAPPPRRDRKS